MIGIDKVLKIPTGIAGFDHIGVGGIPAGRTTLVAGTAGSAKTVFAVQFLAEGIANNDDPGVFVTFEERPQDIRRNFASLGWDIGAYEEAGKWAFVDVSPDIAEEETLVGSFDFGALIARIEHAVVSVGAKRVSLDSLGAVFSRFTDPSTVRTELFRVAQALRDMEVTAILTVERREEDGDIARFGVEEFVADNVIVLRNIREDEKRRRTVEILKYRGTEHGKGEYPFTIIPGQGIIVIPLSNIELDQRSSDVRVTSGNLEIDRMTDGGYFRDSVTLVSGATGTGKTLMVAEFTAGGVMAGEKCLLFAFEESRDQLFRNATGWGYDLEGMERDGSLKVVCAYPETASLEDHLIHMKAILDEFEPDRVAVDSLSALERVASMRGFREFIIALTSFIKHRETAALFTSTSETLLGGSSITETHISTLTDAILLLRYVEMFGEVRRGMTVLKMRGSKHEKDIREFTIDHEGMHVGRAFRNVVGILSGRPHHVNESDAERLTQLFTERPDGGAL